MGANVTHDERLLVDFDHHGESYAEDPFGTLTRLRAQGRMLFSNRHGGYWVPTRYDDVVAVAKDDATYSSKHYVGKPHDTGQGPYSGIVHPGSPVAASFIEMDPPHSLKYRRLLTSWFSRRSIDLLRPGFQQISAALLDARIEEGSIDLVMDFANPVPTIAVLWWLGLPVEDWRSYAEAMHATAHTKPGSEGAARIGELFGHITTMLLSAIEARRRGHHGDLLSELIRFEVDGKPLTDEDLLSLLNLIISGAVDTTTSLVACILYYLGDNPDVRSQLAGHPGDWATAIEEFLRYFTPNQAMARTVTRDVELGGQQLLENDRILVFWAAANHDPAAFDHPEELRLERTPNRHVSFGIGSHFCIGSHFARAEAAVMLQEVCRRIPDYEIDKQRTERYETLGINNGYVRMPARFTPGKKAGTGPPKRLSNGVPAESPADRG
jgi:cytochrome P450